MIEGMISETITPFEHKKGFFKTIAILMGGSMQSSLEKKR